MPIDYKNGKIYKIWSASTDEIYIGSTVQPLSKRIGGHRRQYRAYLKGKTNYTTSFKILEYGNAKIELLEYVECKYREELRAREGHYIRTLNCVNRYIPGRTKEQYYQDNREYILEQKTQYRRDNKERISRVAKQYWQDNKEQLKQYHRQYRKDNKEKISRRDRQKIKCECGSIVTKRHIARHKKTKKHLAFTNQQLI